MSNKVKRLKPQLLKGDADLNAQIFRDRINRQELLKKRHGLNGFPETLPEEEQLVRGFATVLNQCANSITIQHPLLPLQLTVNKLVGAKLGYLISCGDYIQQFLEMINNYIKQGDRVLDVGAGLGVASSLAALKSACTVTALEPNTKLFTIISDNAKLNQVNVKTIAGCLTPEGNEGETEFHIMQDTLSSSLFMHSNSVELSLKVPCVSLYNLIASTNANSLIIDIVGAEIGIFQNIDLSTINKIIIAIHTPIIGERATANIISTLNKHGFELTDIAGSVFVFIKK